MPKRNNLVGQRFDRRIVLSLKGQDKNHRLIWLSKCDCGYEMMCTSQALQRGGPCIMCGHKGPRPWKRKRPYEVNYNALIQRAKHPVHITYEQFVSFTEIKECHYCGKSLVWAEYRRKGYGCPSNMDRKDSSKPYEMDNLVVCCIRCNKAKNTHFTYKEWLELALTIRKWRAK